MNSLPTPKAGDGGLCFAGLKGGNVPSAMPAASSWTRLVVTDEFGAAFVPFSAYLGGYHCSVPAGGTLYYRELFAWWIGGHVTVSIDDPLAPSGSVVATPNTGPQAGYNWCGTGSGTLCNNGIGAAEVHLCQTANPPQEPAVVWVF